MRMISTNDRNDIYLGTDGNLSLSVGLQGVLEACACAAKAQLGEMVLAADEGVPNFQTIWSNAANVPPFEAYLRRTLEAVPEVTEVVSLDVTVASNVLRYIATIRTIYGEGILNG